MITFTEILEIFREYLQSASCVEVLPTKWGYVRLYYEEPYCDSFEAVLCRTPEELFEVLLDHTLAEQEYRVSEASLKSEKNVSEILKATRDFYITKLQKSGE